MIGYEAYDVGTQGGHIRVGLVYDNVCYFELRLSYDLLDVIDEWPEDMIKLFAKLLTLGYLSLGEYFN